MLLYGVVGVMYVVVECSFEVCRVRWRFRQRCSVCGVSVSGMSVRVTTWCHCRGGGVAVVGEVESVEAVGCDPAVRVVCACITSDSALRGPCASGVWGGECNILGSKRTKVSE